MDTYCIVFCFWLLSLSTVLLIFFHVVCQQFVSFCWLVIFHCFIHLQVDGYSICFQVFFAIVIKDAMNICIYLLDKYLGLQLVANMVKCILNLVRNCETIPKWLHHFAVPPEMCEFKLLCVLVHTWCCQSFNLTHSSWCVVIAQCGLNFLVD